MTRIERTDSHHPDFIQLVQHLDQELAERDGNEHAFYDQFNKIDDIKFAVLLYRDNEPVGCGAMKEFSLNEMEIKRMYTARDHRGTGIATMILKELERWAKEMTYQKLILETGKKQPEAIALYLKNGYRVVGNYGQYIGVGNSVCFEKVLSTHPHYA
jgi:GNAT superfamily N-acetyltransferase